MNNQAVQSVRFGSASGGALTQAISAALRLARVALAHVRETIGGGPAGHERLGDMNAQMRRDIGAEGSLGPHSSANRELLFPRI